MAHIPRDSGGLRHALDRAGQLRRPVGHTCRESVGLILSVGETMPTYQLPPGKAETPCRNQEWPFDRPRWATAEEAEQGTKCRAGPDRDGPKCIPGHAERRLKEKGSDNESSRCIDEREECEFGGGTEHGDVIRNGRFEPDKVRVKPDLLS